MLQASSHSFKFFLRLSCRVSTSVHLLSKSAGLQEFFKRGISHLHWTFTITILTCPTHESQNIPIRVNSHFHWLFWRLFFEGFTAFQAFFRWKLRTLGLAGYRCLTQSPILKLYSRKTLKNQGYCQLCSRNHVYLWKSVSHFQSQSFRDMILIMLQHLRVGSSLPNAAQDWNENSFRWVNLQYLECKNCQNVSSLYHNIIYKSSMFVYIIIHIDIYSKYIYMYIYILYTSIYNT